ncbi:MULTISPECIES: hypothetical protein [unclassified Serratia (in: enterobacteria)]|uniref:hypothetical protein n=1 Tax=unclassified Serratia (in: enterobacteria) TaxID=2647522 RepID=UPI000507B00B|nr:MULTISPECIES: hypothetical protein [unclassified Serratia (in: enterobacteria)]KFK96232.1 membrane protein [Serratia sp. Ag2]KFL00649.1 membrane protein [Serratia sp. Ag1]
MKRLFFCIPFVLGPATASAHVKWFVEFDTTKAPQPVLQIMHNPDFWALLVLSVAVIFVTSILDRKWASPVDLPAWQPTLYRLEQTIPAVMRYGTTAFFLLLALGFPHIMLTPELVTDNPVLRYIHFFIALTAFHRRTSFIAGMGILFLYSYAVQLYGTFHMLDYLVFIGTGVYLIIQTVRPNGVQGLDIELLRFTLTYSFLWGALEKFMQPELFYDLLTDHSYLTMGLDWSFFVRACGFVEFCCAWHIYTGKLAGYGGIALMAFFVFAALIPFGMIDFVGHFLFVVPLIAILFAPRKTPVFVTAWGNTVAFSSALVLYTVVGYVSYYVLHYHLHPNLFS